MVTLIYHSQDVGPVCNRLAKAGSGKLAVLHDTDYNGQQLGTAMCWGSRQEVVADRLLNPPGAIVLARDKHASRLALGELSPPTWFQRADVQVPCVIRPRRHHAASKFFVCRGVQEVVRAIRICRLGWYATQLVDKSQEFRVFVLHAHVVAVSERFPAAPGEIAWNLARGGKLINVRRGDWSLAICKAAIVACEKLGLDFGAIDLALCTDGRIVVFEANTAPGLRNKFTLKEIATALEWTETNPQPRPKENPTKWQHLLHPALR